MIISLHQMLESGYEHEKIIFFTHTNTPFMSFLDRYMIFIPEYPGYYWCWIEPLQQWILRWTPIKDIYSPPLLDNSLKWYHVAIPSTIKSPSAIIPLLSWNHYVYYRPDLHKIEIWAHDIEKAVIKTHLFLHSI